MEQPEDDIVDDQAAGDGAEVMEVVITDFLERRRGLGPPEISTGIYNLDRAIIGLRPGRVMVVAGRPGMGKSAFAGSVRRSVVGQGYAVIDFNLEMSKEEILERELAYQAHMNLRRVLTAKDTTEEEAQNVLDVRGRLPKEMWYVFDDCYTMVEIQRRALVVGKKLKKEGKRLGLVVIDYLQLIGGGSEDRQQSISACSRACKMLSKMLGCTVMVLSQLNRGCEYRDDKRPMMMDLRESGAIEQDADTILFVYRDWVYNPSSPPDDAELILRKQRSGPTGTVRARFNPRTVHFDDPPPVVMAAQVGEVPS